MGSAGFCRVIAETWPLQRCRLVSPAGSLCVCARAGADVGQHRLSLVTAQGKADIPGGHQLKFLFG